MNQALRNVLHALVTTALLMACTAMPATSPDTEDVEFLTQLGLMRGHLQVGMSLYRQGFDAQAASHMKHPSDELYSGIESGLRLRGAPGFADELETLANRVEGGAGRAAAEYAYSNVIAAILRAEQTVTATDPAALNKAVILSLMDHAAREYRVGTRDGHVHDLHEYQDAWGFTQVAESLAPRAQDAAAVKRELGALAGLWPVLVPADGGLGDAATIEAAAQRLSRQGK